MSTQERIVAARLKLRERWLRRMQATPAMADAQPQGSGAPNRHGMPSLPPGQKAVDKWPVLDLGKTPRMDTARWSLSVDGAVERPCRLSWDELMALEQVEDRSDFHCVTGWSKLNMGWTGVRFSSIAALVGLQADAGHILVHGYDDYSTNLPLEEALKEDVLLAHRWEGSPLPVEHGGPLRMITPQLWAWKGAKWVRRIEVLVADQKGYWERLGYSNTAHPWRDDRYSK